MLRSPTDDPALKFVVPLVYECDGCFVDATCVSCKNERRVSRRCLLKRRFDSSGEPAAFYLCSTCVLPSCSRCGLKRKYPPPQPFSESPSKRPCNCAAVEADDIVSSQCRHNEGTTRACSVKRDIQRNTGFLCVNHQPVHACGVCGTQLARSRRRGAQPYARFELCASCQPPTATGFNGGDLLALARSSTAGIVAASKLVQYASDLGEDAELGLGDDNKRELRRLLHGPAREAISRHCFVHDDEKVQLAKEYRSGVQHAGHCCATCGIRDPAMVYHLKMFSLHGSHTGLGRLRLRNPRVPREPRTPARTEQLIELPQWMCMPQAAADAMKAHTCELYLPRCDDPDSFEVIEVTAFDLHHVMDRGSATGSGTVAHRRYLHVMEEAVETMEHWEWSTKTRSGEFVPEPDVMVARFWVCQSCQCAFGPRQTGPGSTSAPSAPDPDATPTRYSADAPALSFAAGADPCRSYLPEKVARRTSWGPTEEHPHRHLMCRLPVASPLEMTLLSSVRLHISAVTVSSGAGGSSAGSYEVMRKHTVYFPQALMDESNSAELQPFEHVEDAADALRVAVDGVRVVLVGPKGDWDLLARRALTVTDFTLRAEVIYNQLQLHALSGLLSSTAAPSDAQRTQSRDDDMHVLREALSPARLASLLREGMTCREPTEEEEARVLQQEADVARNRAHDDTAPRTGGVLEVDDTAACPDADGGPESMFAAIAQALLPDQACREIRRGTDP
eukprot:COSAG01_NODE_3198_length_6430_cov_10.203759_9_plen_731_part_01